MSNIIFTSFDVIIEHTLSFPTGNDWTSYTYIHILMYDNNTGELLQTSGYPSGQGDNDLVVPETSEGTCYMRVEQSNISGHTGQVRWDLKFKKTDAKFSDATFDGGDRVNKFFMQ